MPSGLALNLHHKYKVVVSDLHFEWDAGKERANERKHGVSFEEARTAFADDLGLLIYDPDHSEEEDRFVLLGLSSALRLLIVCHCHRSSGAVIRIISARRDNRRERLSYNARWIP